ncbi:MAG: 30S ribosomal protein S1 [Deltaproteobacteria bacterium]|nr:30S ribosomal protein S1 [Deltaproteobacteria bacterium]
MAEDRNDLTEHIEEQVGIEDEKFEEDRKADEPVDIEDEKSEEDLKADEPVDVEDEKSEEDLKADEPVGVEDEKSEEDLKADEPEVAQEETAQPEEEPISDPVVEPETAGQGAETSEAGKEEDFMEMYEESFRRVEEGQVVQGRIIQVDKEFALVDIGYKSEGQVPISEVTKPDGVIEVEVGDTIDVMVERWDDEDGVVLLSKEKASKIKVWEDIKKAYEEDQVVQGVITNRVKGGLSVDIGVPAFLPGSQVGLRPVRDLDQMVGETFEFKVLKYNRKRSNIVLSRRVILEKERESRRAETLATIHEDKVIRGVVKNITEYGAFIDLGGIDGLLHITDMSWGRIGHPSEMFSVADELEVKVLNLDLERERVSLGLKQLVPDPWTTAEEKYPIASHVNGKVVSFTDYGAFVELEKGIEGLIHVSEMSWTKKIRHPSKVVSVGETVEAVVLNISAENRRISLGMKQVVANPWDVVSDKYPVGTTIEGKIKNITDFGLFIGIDEGIDGLVHISDISWTKRIKHPSELFKKGDVVQAIVLNIDKENERFSLGIKQLQKDPWETIPERYGVGDKITGTITNVTDFGLFVELEEGIEGLAHVSEVSTEKIKTPVGRFQVGDILSAKVININPKERRIGLSIKQLERDEEHDLVVNYLSNYQGSQSSLGELLKDNLKERSPDEEPVDQEVVDEKPPDEEPVDQEVVDEKPPDEEPVDQEVVDEKPPDEELIDLKVASQEPADEAAGDEESADQESPDQDMEGQVSETPVDEVEDEDTPEVTTDDVTEQASLDETEEAVGPSIQEPVEPETVEEETDKEV